jgi:hypothetical protein
MTDFWKILRYKISWKSIQWKLSCSMWMDGRTDWHDKANSHFSQFCECAQQKQKWAWEVLCFLMHVICHTNSRLLLCWMILCLRWSYKYFEYVLAVDSIMLNAHTMNEQCRIVCVHSITAVTHLFCHGTGSMKIYTGHCQITLHVVWIRPV